MATVQQLVGRVVGRLQGSTRPRGVPTAITALDVGTEFAKALVVTSEAGPDGTVMGVVRGVGRQRQGLTHMQSGTVSDIDAVVANCGRALAEARAMANLRPTAAVIGIAGELVKGTTASLTARREDPRHTLDDAELEHVMERVQDEALHEAEQRIAWESGLQQLDVRLVHAAIVEMKIDGYPVSNPIGFTGAHLEMGIFNAFAPMVHLGALQSVAAALGLQLLGVIAEPYAVATCLDPGELGDSGAVFIDVGGGTTDVALVRHGGIAGTKMLALGGRAFTKGLVERFDLTFARAETLKVALAEGGDLPEAATSRDELEAALTADAEVWLGGVELMIADLADGELLPARIYLCGGGARLRQIRSALAGDAWWRRLPFARRPEVRSLAPSDVIGVRDATGLLRSEQDVTPMALAHQGLIIDAQTSAVDRAMRLAVRAMEL
jgi:cell division protein FtsA